MAGKMPAPPAGAPQ